MALVLKDRVKQTAAAPGTGTITLSGSATGFQSFSVIGNGNTTYFAIYDPVSGDWEVNYGTYTSSGTTLTRNATPLSSSAGGSLVNFTGVVDVFVTYPSENAVWRDTAGVVVQQDFGAITATSAALTTGTISTAPVNNTDIVNKQYADAIASGIHFHEAVDLATTAALPANTYNNGTSGVGATLTANANGALSVDSTLTVATNRILVKNEVTQANNGVYTVTQVGSAGTPYILTRAADFDSAGTGVDQIDEGDFFLVTSGVVNLNTAWVQQTAPPIVVGTTALVFQQFAAPITYTAGTGLNESPTYTFNIATTGVSAATYGSASTSATIAVNAQGQITSASNTTIAINGTQVSGNIAGQAGSVANALTAGTYLTSGGTYDGSAARTFAVDATDANTASKVVARDSSGNFSAGTITATLSGAATSAGTATNIAGGAANQIPYQTGAATTSFVVAPTVAGTYLNWNGSSFAYTAISLPNNATFNNGGAGDASGTTFNGSAARTISYNTVGASPLAGSSSLTTTGTVTSGTWSASFGAVSGANLTSLTAANISGTVALANGGTASSTAGGARTSLGATTLGSNLFTITNPSAVTFPRFNADNTVSSLDAATFRSAIGAGTSSTTGTVTSITAGTYLTGGTITTSGTLAVDATTTNTASKVVARDASGNFSAGTITATLSGNASTATSATTAGTITSQANSATITATSANTASQIVLRDASGNFSAGTITATLSGNATNVTGTVAVANGGTGQTTGYKLFEATYTSSIDANVNRTAGMYGSYAAAATNTPTNSGILYHFLSGTGGAGDGGQFWQDYVTNNLYLRQRWGGTYGSWLTILSASNYNSYAPTLTGTGASGTWGISITGNAATVTGGITTSNYTTYAVKRTGNIGNADLNSAAYYTGSQVLGYNTASNMPGASFGTMISINERTDTCLQLVVDYSTGNLFTRGVYTTAPTFSAWQTQISNTNYTSYAMPIGSSATNSVDVRAPIFYDSNNTAFYADLAGTTNINILSGNGKNIFTTTDSYLRINESGGFVSGCWFGGVLVQSTGIYAGSNGGTTTSRVAITGGTYNGSNVISIDGSNGVIIAAGDMRAPIFYDQNNTGFYVDPASTSYINGLNVAGQNWRGDITWVTGVNILSSGESSFDVYGGNWQVWDIGNGAPMLNCPYQGQVTIGQAGSRGLYVYGSITASGNVTAYSDERLKKDWALLPDNFIESLAQLKSGTYTRIDSEERQAGISAQGLQKFLPEVVQTDASDTLSVNYGSAAMVSAVELAKEVVDLRARVAQLESLISKLIGD